MKRESIILTAVLASSVAAFGQSSVDAVSKFAWGENIGWTNWRDAGSPAGMQGVQVHFEFLSGFVWSENVGWINLGDGTPANGTVYANATGADFGVNLDADTGNLSGLAWGENIGWINFAAGAQVIPTRAARIEDNRLKGFVWSENVGWINLDDAQRFVAFTPACDPCDVNCNGTVNQFDIPPFVEALQTHTGCSPCAGDTNGNGTVNTFDIFGFLDCLTP